jgi:hypothetical protein
MQRKHCHCRSYQKYSRWQPTEACCPVREPINVGLSRVFATVPMRSTCIYVVTGQPAACHWGLLALDPIRASSALAHVRTCPRILRYYALRKFLVKYQHHCLPLRP